MGTFGLYCFYINGHFRAFVILPKEWFTGLNNLVNLTLMLEESKEDHAII